MSQVAEGIVTIKNEQGLHARPASLFVKKASSFKDHEVFVEFEESEINGKSIMSLLTLGAGHGSVLRIKVTGPDAATVLAEMCDIVENHFDIE